VELAGVGMILRSVNSNAALIVRSLLPGSPAAAAGVQPGDFIIEVDGVKVSNKGVQVASEVILGPINSVARIKLVRMQGAKRVPLDVLVVRELKATAEPEFKLRADSDRCTTQHLHLACLQKTAEHGQQTDAVGDAGGRAQVGGEHASSGCAPARTPAEEAAVDRVLQGADLHLRRSATDGWTRVHARVTGSGELVLRTASMLGKAVEIPAARCMWAGSVPEAYSPKMSAKQFDEMNRKLFVMVEDGPQLLAHCSGGAISAVQGTSLELLAVSEASRDEWVRGISVIAAQAPRCAPQPAKRVAGQAVTVAMRLPQLHRRLQSTPAPEACTTQSRVVDVLPKAAEEARRMRADGPGPCGHEQAGWEEEHQHQPQFPGAAGNQTPGDEATTPKSYPAEGPVLDEASDGSLPCPQHPTPIPAQAMHAEIGDQDDGSGEEDDDDDEEEEEEEGEMERLSGLAMSRIACFEAAAARPSPVANNLEEQWQRTARRWQQGPRGGGGGGGGGGRGATTAFVAAAGSASSSHSSPASGEKPQAGATVGVTLVPDKESLPRHAHTSGHTSPRGSDLLVTTSASRSLEALDSAAAGVRTLQQVPLKPQPTKMSKVGGGGGGGGGGGKVNMGGGGRDLAALMEARRKVQEANEDEGYYF